MTARDLLLTTFLMILGDQRLSGHKKNDHNNFRELTKKEVDVILGYIQLWPQRCVDTFVRNHPVDSNLAQFPGNACVVIEI